MRSKIDMDQFAEEVQARLAQVLDQTRLTGFTKAAALTRARGAAEARELARARARDGADAPATVEVAATLLVQAETVSQLGHDIRATELLTRAKAANVVALGRVLGEAGRPAAGALVVLGVSGAGAPVFVPIAEAVVDSSGLFVVEMNRDEFEKRLGNAQELVAQARDKSGQTVREVRVPVRREVREVLVIHFDLAAKTPPGKGGPTGPAPTPATPTPTRPSTPSPVTPAPTQPTPVPRVAPALSDVRGLGAARIARLNERSITDLAGLARTPPEQLAQLLRVSADQAAAFVQEARDLLRQA